MEQEQISFTVVQSSDQSLALEIQGPEGAWRLPLSMEQADKLCEELQGMVAETRRSQKISQLQSFVEQIMCRIPAGSFEMGSSLGTDFPNDEMPKHEVDISHTFFLSQIPVGQPFYRMLTQNEPSRYPGEEYPVDSLSWFDAILFCNQLSILLDLEPCYEIQGQEVYWHRNRKGYRLPTEAEWEYAARAGKDYQYSGGQLNEVSWHSANSSNHVHPSGMKKPNAWGLYDMTGLIFEWCWDRFGSYTNTKKVDPVGPDVGTERVCRGGAWNRDSWFARIAFRYGENPHSRCSNIGFRIARTR